MNAVEVDERFARIARMSRLLSLSCVLGITVSCTFLLAAGVALTSLESEAGGSSWVLERLAAGEPLSLELAELRTYSLTLVDKVLLFALVLGPALTTIFCLTLCLKILRDFRRARVFTDESVRRVRLIGWVLLGAWLARKLFAATSLYLGGWNLPTVALTLDGVPGPLVFIALVFLVAWVVDIGRSMDVDRRLTI